MSAPDPQRRKLYAWEDREVAPRDLSMVPYARLQGLVDHVWVQEGLSWAPLVRPLKQPAYAPSRRKICTLCFWWSDTSTSPLAAAASSM